jgi:hypothetical protein
MMSPVIPLRVLACGLLTLVAANDWIELAILGHLSQIHTLQSKSVMRLNEL